MVGSSIEQAQEHLRMLFGRHEWTEGAQLAVSWRTTRGGLATNWFAASELQRAARAVIRRAKTTDTYVGCALRRFRPSKGRGGRAICLPVPALWVDLDTDEGAHKLRSGERNPTRTEAEQMIAACPLAPQVTVHSGGGFQLWWLLAEPLDTADEAQFILMKRLKAWWAQESARRGVHLDEGVIADPARILRIAGSLNHKKDAPRPVQIVSTEDVAPYARRELEAALPALRELPKRPKAAMAKHSARRGRTSAAAIRGTDSLYRRFSLAYPVGQMLQDLGLAELVSGDAHGDGRWWLETGDPDYCEHAATYLPMMSGPDTGEDGAPNRGESRPQTLTVFDVAAHEDMGLEDHHHSLDAFDLLQLWVCDGNGRRAYRIATLYDGHPELLANRLRIHPGRGEFASYIPDPIFEQEPAKRPSELT